VAAVIAPIIAPSGPRGVGNYRPRHSAYQTARYRSTSGTAGKPADQRTGTTTDQSAARHTVLPSIRTSSQYYCHCNHSQCFTHLL
jgi:hypothetical protein